MAALTIALAAGSAAFLFFPGKVILALGALLGGLSLAVVVYYLPGAIRDMRAGRFDRVAQLTLGIVLGWLSVFLTRGLASAVRLTDDHTLANSPLVAVYLLIAILAAVLHITAPGSSSAGVIPRRNWVNLTLAVALAALAAAALVLIDTAP